MTIKILYSIILKILYFLKNEIKYSFKIGDNSVKMFETNKVTPILFLKLTLKNYSCPFLFLWSPEFLGY